jgi:ClpP class serine protease
MTNPPSEFPTRAEIRAKATEMWEQIAKAVAAGRNPHQTQLDLLDEQAKYAATLGDETVGNKYLDMLGQEVEALGANAGDQQRKVDEAKVGQGAWLLGVVFGLIIGVPILLRACS